MSRIPGYLKSTILTRYLIKSFIVPFLIGEIFFSFVILLFNLRQLIQAALEKGIEAGMLMKLSLFSMGWTLGMTIPMSALLAIILTIGALNTDQEIIVMRAGGIAYFRIFRPYLVFGFIMAGILLWYQMDVVPYCMRMVGVMGDRIANYNPTALIEAGQFTALDEQKSGARHIYVDSITTDNIEKTTILKGIQIRKVENKGGTNKLTELVFAERGEKILKNIENRENNSGGEQVRALRLYNGFIYIPDSGSKGFEKIDFKDDGYMDINMRENFSRLESAKAEISIFEMTVTQLLDKMDALEDTVANKDAIIHIKTEFYKRTALPFAALILILCGFPLGIINKRSGKGAGFGQAIILIFVYFSFYLSADAIGVHTSLGPVLSAWIGNIVVFVFGISLYIIRTTDILWKIKIPSFKFFKGASGKT
ncbi:MAG: LptF/LptG family permease [Spirochaetia bacterium]|nr:LptF/LptG family permease [Spirochaetia bacterium]